MKQSHFPRLLTRHVATTILILAALLRPGPLHAWNPNARFCFRDVINTPDTWLQPPNIDGTVAGDNGWTSAWRYVFNNGTFIQDVTVQGIKDSTFLYLSFEINNDPQLDSDDAIVIALDPTGTASNRRLLQIFPVVPAGSASPIPMNYWQGFPWTGGGIVPPAGTQAAVTVAGPSGNRSWFVELKLPRAGFGIPAAGDFGMYFNVVPVLGGGLTPDYPWPPGTPSMMGDLQQTPDVNSWGEGTVAAVTCSGVSVAASDIFTDNTPPTKINLNAPNTFHAIAHNNTIDGSGTLIDAKDIRATFKIANFGLSNHWQPVPATAPATNPSATATISAGTTADFTTAWTLSAAEQATYNTPTTEHQCILVELGTTSTGPPATTVFANKSAWNNMDFGTASTYASTATIDARGWNHPPEGGRNHALDIFVTRQTDALDREDVIKSLRSGEQGRLKRTPTFGGSWGDLKHLTNWPVERDEHFKEFVVLLDKSRTQVSQLTYFVHGCRRTGTFLSIHGNSYERCERVGSFGYVLRHAGLGAVSWEATLEGDLKRVGDAEHYQLEIPVERTVSLRTRFVVKDEPFIGGNGGGGGGCGCMKPNSSSRGGAALGLIGLAGYLPRWRQRRRRRPPRDL